MKYLLAGPGCSSGVAVAQTAAAHECLNGLILSGLAAGYLATRTRDTWPRHTSIVPFKYFLV